MSQKPQAIAGFHLEPNVTRTRGKKRGKQRDKTKGTEGRPDRPEPAKKARTDRPEQGGKK